MNLALHPKLKRYLIIALKNAVFAVLTNSALVFQWHFIFNFDNWAGVYAVLRATGSVIIARETLIWLPKLLKWAQTDADPNIPMQALEHAADANKEVGAAIETAKEKIAEIPPKPGA
jgi:hypothetical protein